MSEEGEVQAQLLGAAIRRARDRTSEKKATEGTDRGGGGGSCRSTSRPEKGVPSRKGVHI